MFSISLRNSYSSRRESQADQYLFFAKRQSREHRAVGKPLTSEKQQYSKDLILLEISLGVKASSRQIPLVLSCFSLAGELKDLRNAALHLHRTAFNLVVA